MAAMEVQPEELRPRDVIPGNPTRVVRSTQKTPGGQYVVVVCESGPDYFAEVGRKLWIVRG